jgi:hypothetical protein
LLAGRCTCVDPLGKSGRGASEINYADVGRIQAKEAGMWGRVLDYISVEIFCPVDPVNKVYGGWGSGVHVYRAHHAYARLGYYFLGADFTCNTREHVKFPLIGVSQERLMGLKRLMADSLSRILKSGAE